MRNTISHLLSRLLNSGAAFDAPASHRHTVSDRQEDTPQAAQVAGWQQHEIVNDKVPSDENERSDANQ